MSIYGKPSTKYTEVMLKIIITLLLMLLSFELKAGDKGVRILAYHTFMGDKNIYSFSHEEFKKQCEELKSEGFTFITFENFKKGEFTGDKNILLTIDDGHKTVYDAYKQVLRPLGIKPLLAVYPAITGRQKFALTWEQLKEMLNDGCTLASHGYYHNFCDEKAIKKSFKAVEKEIKKSKAVLEEKLGVKVDTFVYPFGRYSPKTKVMVKDAGYSYAMNIYAGTAKIGANPDYEIPRYLMTRSKITHISELFLKSKNKKTDISEVKKPDAAFAAADKEFATNNSVNPENLTAAPPKNTVIESIKERIYSLIIAVYKVNVSFVNEMHAKVSKINSRIREFFSRLKVSES